MESELEGVADYAMQQPNVTGYLCVDNEGLCLAAKGQASQQLSGMIRQLASLASEIEEPNKSDGTSKEPPVIRVDLDQSKVLIQSRDNVTTALMRSI